MDEREDNQHSEVAPGLKGGVILMRFNICVRWHFLSFDVLQSIGAAPV